MARHRYQQHEFQGPVNDTAPRQSLEQPAARLPGPAKPRTSNQDDAPGCSAGPASHASLPRPKPWQPRAQLQCFLSVVKSDGCPEDAAGGLPLGAALRARAGGVFPDRCCLRAARPPPCAPAKSQTPFLTHSFTPSVIRPCGTMFADVVVSRTDDWATHRVGAGGLPSRTVRAVPERGAASAPASSEPTMLWSPLQEQVSGGREPGHSQEGPSRPHTPPESSRG